ncbi:EscU/YscU/HrcU family type III secretion system export apparatus switch protein [Sphingomonas crocodyli]|uniref:EscU/YscU/HrcU family type III secretion system export apparatus switch protein n=1 Tax=Sphingomonas crocodyli TaxID=1979270 RepID=A0A437M6F5_9SPHN|nr:EscU/YscU/HrcU family type III secretion system export apparatus switch protein [Sphingomonas crocodyli]RVT93288.1 EscU/YscU/HrcU family type III secretion system export apparatus switch protein [Sphingomonas crocodyli]
MADKNDGGDKTELPTQKRLDDARKKGDVAKSKDLTSTATLFAWLLVLLFGSGIAAGRIGSLFEDGFAMISRGDPFPHAVGQLGWSAFLALLVITGLAMIPASIVGVLTEFLQAGGVFTFEKLKPSLDKMNPMEGFKRMFSLDNLVELAKTMAKAILIAGVTFLVLRGSLAEIIEKTGPMLLPTAETDGRGAAAAVIAYTGNITRSVLLWTFGTFVMVAVLDMAWQRHSYIKKMKMSMRDIRDEVKENEGDPLIKSNRRQLHQEWAEQNAVGAARNANVLVTNPTHLAIAIDYDPESCPVPVMTGKGEGPLAQAMREAAEEEGVPIVRYVEVARGLYEHGAVDEVIPRDMFDAIAQIILWAQKVRDEGGPRTTDMTKDPTLAMEA